MEQPTTIEVPANAPHAYWENWAEQISLGNGGPTILIRTFRTGDTGRSDAQYIVDRLASGLHFGKVLP